MPRQLAMQLAYHRVHEGRVASTYESVVTLRFFRGRTEAGRTASKATVAFCRAMDAAPDGEASPARKVALLRAAARGHGRTVAAAAAGKGIDRHLFALRIAALEGGLAVPALTTIHVGVWHRTGLTVDHTTAARAHRIYGAAEGGRP